MHSGRAACVRPQGKIQRALDQRMQQGRQSSADLARHLLNRFGQYVA